MRLSTALAKHWPALLAGGLAISSLALLWRVRDTPLGLGTFARFDALSAFFLFALFGGITLALAARPARFSMRWLRPVAVAGALVLAFSTTLTLAIGGAYFALALLTFDWLAWATAEEGPPATLVERAVRVLRRAVLAAPTLLAASSLLLGCGALALRGAARYDDRAAGAALDSFAFWFVLLAASIVCAPLLRTTNDERRTTNNEIGLLRFAWLYPLARLYSLGPWNSGWSFATLLLGGALALWCACSALIRPDASTRNHRTQSSYLALALSGLGLSNSAGVAAACYAVLAYLVLWVGHSEWGTEDPAHPPSAIPHPPSPIPPTWLLSSALPLTAPFVAVWMLIGASVAGGVALLAGVAWLAALIHGLAVALWDGTEPAQARRPLLVAGALSLALGAGAPPIARLLILPVVAQLQGGLTPFGDVNIWPWVGVAASDSAHTQVATLPSVAIALLMLVLTALVYVVVRLRELRRADQPAEPPEATAVASPLLSYLRDEVPWLGGLLGANSRSQRQPGDSE